MTSNRAVATALPANWAKMTPAQKRKYRLDSYVSTEGRSFVSPAAKKEYQVRVQRMVDVLNVQEPDMVPVNLPAGSVHLTLYGLDAHATFYDYEKVVKACQKFNEKYSEELEYFATPSFTPGAGDGHPGLQDLHLAGARASRGCQRPPVHRRRIHDGGRI